MVENGLKRLELIEPTFAFYTSSRSFYLGNVYYAFSKYHIPNGLNKFANLKHDHTMNKTRMLAYVGIEHDYPIKTYIPYKRITNA